MSGAGPDGSRTLYVRVEGRVQGVGFRRFVERTAVALGLAGWTRNLTDGSVEILAFGPAAAVERLCERLRAGPPHAAVARLVEQPAAPEVAESLPFRVLPDARPGAPIPQADERG